MIFEWNLADKLSLGQTIVFAVQSIVLGVTFGAVKKQAKAADAHVSKVMIKRKKLPL
jgi:hypothetical protein